MSITARVGVPPDDEDDAGNDEDEEPTMWAFVSARLRQWLVLAVVVPIVVSLVHLIRTRLEKKHGRTALVKGLQAVEDFGQRHRRDRRGRRAADRADDRAGRR